LLKERCLKRAEDRLQVEKKYHIPYEIPDYRNVLGGIDI
jgi:hypothetical protein